MYPAYKYILLYNVKQKGEERKGKSHMPFKAINIFILMHKHNKPKWYVGWGGGGYVSLIMDHLFNWNELWTCRNLFKNCVIERKLIENNFIYVERWKKKLHYLHLKKMSIFLLKKIKTFWERLILRKNVINFWEKGFEKGFPLDFLWKGLFFNGKNIRKEQSYFKE